MVKLFALSVLYKPTSDVSPTTLKAAYDLQQFSFFQRSSIQEFMAFTSKIITERCAVGSRQSVKEQEYMCHVFVRSDGLAGVVVSDHEYQYRVAHTMIDKVLDEFAAKVPSHLWPGTHETAIPFTELPALLAKWQNPREADAITRVQEEVEDTKIILHNTIEAVLERGEKLDDLVNKSEMLSMQSKAFYKTARKTNSCCNFG
ncbi:hypothetical protein HAZT_HAZT005910 [Hyalella azteca]|uniref:Synaptobrevin homolog YKT6 n=1 Tax=Hyalella azteca TaxID=294128 RepID=A0A6A0GUD0_HYAAZ|nr:synaptobrevin homolog YKT6 [Hyalella azteca]KAA0188890.1 hypothetical protein HAZT_HAZT005910 [Hyalella azteca]